MKFELPDNLMVSVSGVRGRVAEALTPEIVTRFAAAFGSYLRSETGKRPRVVVARDSRTSGPMFMRAAIAALQSVGCDVVEAGIAPTPTALFAIRQHQAAGAIVVTASHNPVEWNALKFASGEGMFLDAQQAPRMREFLAEDKILRAAWDQLGDVATDNAVVHRHLDAVLKIPYLDVAALRKRKFKVALDCVHGAGAVLLPKLLQELGCEMVGIGLQPDGFFPREPEPVAANLGDLERLVRESGADVGLATDPDADRLSVVSNNGKAIGEDFTLAFASMLVLRHKRGTVVTNLSTSRLLEDVTAAAGVSLVRAPVGEINVARRMEAENAVVGGEGNGGVILPGVCWVRDSLSGMALTLSLLASRKQPLSEIVDQLPRYKMIKHKFDLQKIGGAAAVTPALERVRNAFADQRISTVDGVRIDFAGPQGGWVHLRPSNTEPIVRLIAEAPTDSRAWELIDEVAVAAKLKE